MASVSDRRSRIGRAGWLFADLSIVLMILFAATTVKTSGPDCTGSDATTGECAISTTTTAPDDPDSGDGAANGFRPDPVEFVIAGGAKMDSAKLRTRLNNEIAKLMKVPPSHFGVIIVYGGSSGRSSQLGDRDAREAVEKISPTRGQSWERVRKITYFVAAHNNGLTPGHLQFKMFPYLAE